MSYEIRAMSLGEILDTGFQLVRDHFRVLVSIAAILYVPLALLQGLLEEAAMGDPVTAATLIGVMVVLSAFAAPLVLAGTTHALGEVYLGRPATVGDALRTGAQVFLPLLGTWILAYLIVIAGFLLLIVPGIYLMLCFLLLSQVMVLERTFALEGMRRSRELMRGHLLRGFAVVFIASLLVGLLGSGVQLVVGWLPVVGPLAAGLAQAIGAAYGSAIAVVLYFDIRCRKEAFDLEHLSQLVEQSGHRPGAV